MYFKLEPDEHETDLLVPVSTRVGAEADLPAELLDWLRVRCADQDAAEDLVHGVNLAVKAGYDRGFDGGYANGIGAGRRLERNGQRW